MCGYFLPLVAGECPPSMAAADERDRVPARVSRYTSRWHEERDEGVGFRYGSKKSVRVCVCVCVCVLFQGM